MFEAVCTCKGVCVCEACMTMHACFLHVCFLLCFECMQHIAHTPTQAQSKQNKMLP